MLSLRNFVTCLDRVVGCLLSSDRNDNESSQPCQWMLSNNPPCPKPPAPRHLLDPELENDPPHRLRRDAMHLLRHSGRY